MSLVADYGTSSGSSSSESESEPELSPETDSHTKPKLPTPSFNNDSNDIQTSVFKNPFKEAENAKEALLQKHVKMVDSKDNVIVINGKKICWNYRKGRCRFGHNCKFAHDSDLQKTKEQLESEKQYQSGIVCQNQPLAQATKEIDEAQQDDTEDVTKKKRKRPGLTQGLVPGKKVMKNYFQHK